MLFDKSLFSSRSTFKWLTLMISSVNELSTNIYKISKTSSYLTVTFYLLQQHKNKIDDLIEKPQQKMVAKALEHAKMVSKRNSVIRLVRMYPGVRLSAEKTAQKCTFLT